MRRVRRDGLAEGDVRHGGGSAWRMDDDLVVVLYGGMDEGLCKYICIYICWWVM